MDYETTENWKKKKNYRALRSFDRSKRSIYRVLDTCITFYCFSLAEWMLQANAKCVICTISRKSFHLIGRYRFFGMVQYVWYYVRFAFMFPFAAFYHNFLLWHIFFLSRTAFVIHQHIEASSYRVDTKQSFSFSWPSRLNSMKSWVHSYLDYK